MREDHAVDMAKMLIDAFPQTVVGANTLTIYARAFLPWDESLAFAAIQELIEDRKNERLPSVAACRSAYGTICAHRDDHAAEIEHEAAAARARQQADAVAAGGPMRLPATAELAWTIEGANWTRHGQLPAGWTDADLADHERLAMQRHMERGATYLDRAKVAAAAIGEVITKAAPAPA